MEYKRTCDLCGRGFIHPHHVFYWQDAVCFECVKDLDLFILEPEDVIILPAEGDHYGQ